MKLKNKSDGLRLQLRGWYQDCISHEIEPLEVYEMLLSESKVLKDNALNKYERTSEIHDLLIGNLSANDFNP